MNMGYLKGAFCINLKDKMDRRKHCEVEYDRAGMSAEFFEAVDGRNKPVEYSPPNSDDVRMDIEEINEVAHEFSIFNDRMNTAETACALSHFLVWEKIGEIANQNNEEYYLVNEDDFNVIDVSDLEEYVSSKDILSYDMIYLGYRGGDNFPTLMQNMSRLLKMIWLRIKQLKNPSVLNKFRYNLCRYNFPLDTGSKYYYRSGMHWGGHSYLLNYSAAKALIRANVALRFLPDEAMRYAILDDSLRAGISNKKFFGCEEALGSDLRSDGDHKLHHERFSTK